MFLGFTSSGGTVEPAELAEGTVFPALMCSDSAEQEERTLTEKGLILSVADPDGESMTAISHGVSRR